MKFIITVFISLSSVSAFTQSNDELLKGLRKFKATKSNTEAVVAVTKKTEDQTVSISKEKIGSCDEDTASIPLAFLSGLLIGEDDLSIQHNPRTMIMTMKTGDMISNCNDMIEWDVVETKIGSEQVYGVKAKIKSCKTTKEVPSCKYSVKDRSSGKTVTRTDLAFPPTFDGFKSCLLASKVFDQGQVVESNIQHGSDSFSHKIKESGRVMFVTHGQDAPNFSLMYDKSYEQIINCDHFENIAEGGKSIKSQEDEENDKKAAELQLLQKQYDDHKVKCTVADYLKVSESFDKINDLSKEMIKLIDPLIRLAAQEVAKAMADPKYEVTEADLKVIADFDKLVVQERVKDAVDTYNEMVEADSPRKEELKKDLDIIVADLKSLNTGKYFTSKMVDGLLVKGRFDQARSINTMKLNLVHHGNLGTQKTNISPAKAAALIAAAQLDFDADMEIEKERYAYKTGEDSGLAEYYTHLASQMRQNIQTRTHNYSQEIQAEFARTQQGGYCFRYFRNTTKCIQQAQARIQELQAELTHYNNVDAERAAEYDLKGKDYGKLEEEGRAYLANEGTEAPEPTAATATNKREVANDSNLRPNPSAGQAYSFDYNQGQGNQQQQQNPTNPYANNNMFQQQQNPWGNTNNYQQPWMGQQSYNYNQNGNAGMQSGMYQQNYNGYSPTGNNGAYNFNWNGGGQQSQQPYGGQYQQQQPWQQQGYNQYSLYR